MLCAPSVVPPVTPWSRKIRVKNQLSGATVSVLADGTEVGRAQVGRPDGFVPLNAGVNLLPGQLLVARQELNGETSISPPKSSGVAVLNSPTPQILAGIHSRAPLYECGRCLWLEGIVPGADVEVDIGAVQTVSSDWTGVHVDGPAFGNTQVRARQRSGTVLGPWVNLPKPIKQKTETDRQQIFAPALELPLHACQRSVELREVMPGAEVTLNVIDRSGVAAQTSQFCLGSTKGLLWLSRPLELTQRVATMQEYPDCLPPSQWADFPVTDWVPTPPSFLHPVCVGDREVELSGVETGAALEFIVGGKHFPAEAGEPPHKFIIPFLGNVTRLGVRQTVCDTGPWSGENWIDLIPMGSADHPRIIEPLHSCGLAVAIEGASDGTDVRIVSQKWGGVIGEAVGNGDRFLNVRLIFPLIDGDSLHLEIVQCGLLKALPETASVVSAPRLLPLPSLDDPLDDVGGTVIVWDSVAGAMIDVELVDGDPPYAGTLLCSEPVAQENGIIPVPSIPPKARVRASQRLCDRQSGPSPSVAIGNRAAHYVQSSTTRICQLTGARGNAGRPPRFDPLPLGIIGTDLGIPVEQNGRIYLFFGDCDPFLFGMNADADPIAWTTDWPETTGGPLLTWLRGKFIFTFRRLHVEGFDWLGNFEVPTGAFSYGGRIYVFIGRDTVDPAAGEEDFCGDGKRRMRASQLAVTKNPSNDPGDGLQHLYDVAKVKGPFQHAGRWLVHVSPTVVRNSDWPGLPASTGDGLIMFGTACYQHSNVHLAWAPLEQADPVIPDPSTWYYRLKGEPADGLDPENWRRADRLAGKTPSALHGRGELGEISVVYEPTLRRWVMAYMADGKIMVRMAREPWGDWSPEIAVFDGNSPSMAADNLPGHRFVGLPHDWEGRSTVPYAPYLVGRWLHFDRSTRQLKMHYTMSVEHPPYNVQLMRSAVIFTMGQKYP